MSTMKCYEVENLLGCESLFNRKLFFIAKGFIRMAKSHKWKTAGPSLNV